MELLRFIVNLLYNLNVYLQWFFLIFLFFLLNSQLHKVHRVSDKWQLYALNISSKIICRLQL